MPDGAGRGVSSDAHGNGAPASSSGREPRISHDSTPVPMSGLLATGGPGASSGRADDIAVGTLTFADGSTYNGTLKHGIPDGLGTCTWKDGNKYDGEWKNGVMHGFGTFLWTSGQRYDGEWKDGQRDGVGVKMYADGSTFDGFWRDGKKNGVGVFRPPPQGGSMFSKARLSQRMMGPRDEEADGEASSAGAWQSMSAGGPAGNGTMPSANEPPHASSADSSVGGVTVTPKKKQVFIRKYEDGRLLREDKLGKEDIKLIFGDLPKPTKKLRKRVKKALGIGKKLQQKQGQLLYKGMPAYDLMIRLQLGIRYSVGLSNWQQDPRKGAVNLSKTSLAPSDFTDKFKVFFPSSGSSKTPAHPSSDFKWKDYCPRVFRRLRQMWGIHDAEYMLSLGGSSALWQLNSPGKSGCMFFLSDDEKFLIKTTRKSEIKTLIEMLPAYFKHMEAYPGSLVTRFYGVHGVKQVHGRTVRFLVMSNIFCTELQIHRKFDLKGSTEGRTAGPKVDPSDPKSVFKDLDLDLTLRLPPATHAKLMGQMQRDAEFLKRINVMDYSLLLGIHFCGRVAHPAPSLGTATTADAGGAFAAAAGAAAAAAAAAGGGGGGGGAAAAGRASLAALPSPRGGGDGGAAPERVSPSLQPSLEALGVALPPSPSPGERGGGTQGGAAGAGPSLPPGGVGAASPPTTLSPTLSMRLEYELVAAAMHGDGGAGGGGGAWGASPPEGEAVGRQQALGSGQEVTAERARNFDVFSNKKEVAHRLALIEQRMHDLNYTDHRIQDVLGLAKLKILGDTLKAGSKGQAKPAAVLKAMQQWRQEALDLRPHGDPIMEGGSDDGELGDGTGDAMRGPTSSRDEAALQQPGAQVPWALVGSTSGSVRDEGGGGTTGMGQASGGTEPQHIGYNIAAVAIHKASIAKQELAKAQHSTGTRPPLQPPDPGPEEVVVYVGIIDILQDYNTRKLFERGFKSLVHDGDAISVAPPKLYSQRFYNFVNDQVFQVDDPPILPRQPRAPRPLNGYIAEGEEEEDDDEDTEEAEK